jgi:hypothetical protein
LHRAGSSNRALGKANFGDFGSASGGKQDREYLWHGRRDQQQQQQLAAGHGFGTQQQQKQKLPPHVVAKALQNPGIQNLARCVAYHRACLLELPLDAAGAEELVGVVQDMCAALQTMLSL